jgi:putative glutamine amidotransferase
MSKTPIVLVCCNRLENFPGTPAHVVRETYIRALIEISGCIPLLLPVIGAAFDITKIIDRIDGILLTGSSSHVSPTCYGGKREFEDKYLDTTRDEMTVPLIKAAVEADLPLFAVCRGFQELNVACGGTLHQYLHKIPGTLDHRSKEDLTLLENLHNHAHKVKSQIGGLFEKWALPKEFSVNSLHTQGADKIGKDLHVEAICEDGIIEAISMPGKRFVMGTQWHPEGDCFINAPCGRLFEEFGKTLHEKAIHAPTV